MLQGNFRLAFDSIKRTKMRSLFTMLGIIIGVVSVLTTISIGQGVKNEVNKQIDEYGRDLITVRAGQDVTRDESGTITDVDIFSVYGNATSLNDSDVEAVSNAADVQTVAPLSSVDGVISYEGKEFPGANVVATTSSFPDLLNHKVEFGAFYNDADEGRKFVVIGKSVAERLFEENVPIGKSLQFRGESYVVKGVFAEFETTPFVPGPNYNDAVFIPYVTGKSINEGVPQIFQILAKPTSPELVSSAQNQITENLLRVHGGQGDFSVLKQEETLAITNNLLNLLTLLVGAIAAISLLVGGIGVMNIMIVSVTERTHEIGVRKAIGATNSQIMGQFVSEAVILSAVGAILGICLTLAISIVLRVTTDLSPVLPPLVAVAAFAIATLVGGIFGLAPAAKAARKDPIAALRHE